MLPISQPLPWRASDLTTWGAQLWLVNHEDGDREDLEKDYKNEFEQKSTVREQKGIHLCLPE